MEGGSSEQGRPVRLLHRFVPRCKGRLSTLQMPLTKGEQNCRSATPDFYASLLIQFDVSKKEKRFFFFFSYYIAGFLCAYLGVCSFNVWPRRQAYPK